MYRFWRTAVPFLNALPNISSTRELQFRLAKILRKMGVERCSITLTPRKEQTIEDVLLLYWFSEAWRRRYTEERYLDIDPAHKLAVRMARPFLWREAFQGTLTANRRRLLCDISDARLENTLAVPLRGRVFSGIAWLGGESIEQEPYMPLYNLVLTCALETAASLRGVAPPASILSPRQRDVLSWAAEGKSTEDIADVLGVSIKTVEAHVAEAMRKLDATSRAHAVATALRYKIIT